MQPAATHSQSFLVIDEASPSFTSRAGTQTAQGSVRQNWQQQQQGAGATEMKPAPDPFHKPPVFKNNHQGDLANDLFIDQPR